MCIPQSKSPKYRTSHSQVQTRSPRRRPRPAAAPDGSPRGQARPPGRRTPRPPRPPNGSPGGGALRGGGDLGRPPRQNPHTDRDTDRDTDGDTDRDTDGHTDRDTDGETDREPTPRKRARVCRESRDSSAVGVRGSNDPVQSPGARQPPPDEVPRIAYERIGYETSIESGMKHHTHQYILRKRHIFDNSQTNFG